ncbi:MAG: hypothetical protein ACK6AD_09505 [Cyanobacteriota bacterium]
MLCSVVLLASILAPAAARVQANDLAPTAGRAALINRATETKLHGDWSGIDQKSGINLLFARQGHNDVLVRLKR